MTTQTVTLTLSVTFDSKRTDAESVASALDTLLLTAASTPGILEEYGDIDIGEFVVPSDVA